MFTKTELILFWIIIILCVAPVAAYLGIVTWEHFNEPEYPYSGFCPDTPQHFE